MNQESVKNPQETVNWRERFVSDFMTHFKNDKFYTDKEKLEMFNNAVLAVRNNTPEIGNLNSAEEVMKKLPKDEYYKIIERLKEILNRKGDKKMMDVFSELGSA